MDTVCKKLSYFSRFFLYTAKAYATRLGTTGHRQVSGGYLLGRVFHDVVEGVTVKAPDDTWGEGLDGGSSWSVIEKCKFTKSFAWLVDLELCGLGVARENLRAVERA